MLSYSQQCWAPSLEQVHDYADQCFDTDTGINSSITKLCEFAENALDIQEAGFRASKEKLHLIQNGYKADLDELRRKQAKEILALKTSHREALNFERNRCKRKIDQIEAKFKMKYQHQKVQEHKFTEKWRLTQTNAFINE